ncbi:MAG: hypothetical protein A3B99_02075 [Candidatus Yanofskybacteria bacterium RIFCSPHIGHO2_02_FULL_44_12b]|uniref:Phosphomannomutase/phosphoglucomutase n=2 Tax=Candidatus Yanofskyibacteriota TaxID=1752733 RepID=A0A1F8GNJ4_9BACT|nr:MAG: Phosphomannomutase [Candidatus Yanofskybacteria bacterium GW2011_GWA2_44_9]OGN05190.1 MAG: hypothetical protein A2659_04150 [Candidatus Yanofskybacteria bacterium RIFCSPHIGHO2_01_FULL_44_24]OGN15249.1 MAG: hypothetical protein A3B99_02075 [Candidatus Yanofskybacteria bacterium RIFCSPHIGHO2_02_FULL_44_12b]OGN26911.1 MAG: hypothetical protein A2925_01410 [Candidatus Yanofskybacteria bacterium RIFCSPLOWO2_01_FULL_44_22]
MSNIFHAYDVRGIYPTELNEETAFRIGKAAVKHLKAKVLVVGEDARISSPALREQLVRGITSMGCDVLYIGRCTTPLFYFSVTNLKTDGGVMVTASHNPPEYGGFKIVRAGSMPVSGDSGLMEVKELSGTEIPQSGKIGKVKNESLLNDYVDFAIEKSGIKKGEKLGLKLVVDAGNGMTPLVLNPLRDRLEVPFVPLFFNIDGTFPSHSPDISRVESLTALTNMVVTEKADLGVAFDGDGDRIMFVGHDGTIIRSEYILALLFSSGNSLFKKHKTVYDLRFSREIKKLFGERGIPSRVGYTFIKRNMIEKDCDIGAEISGHIFFKETNYSEMSILVMLKILKIMADSKRPIMGMIAPWQKGFYSGEINIELGGKMQAADILSRLKIKYREGRIDELDGVTVEYHDWWFNLRPSNTQPIVRLVVEADTKELMEQKVGELTFSIKNAL